MKHINEKYHRNTSKKAFIWSRSNREKTDNKKGQHLKRLCTNGNFIVKGIFKRDRRIGDDYKA